MNRYSVHFKRPKRKRLHSLTVWAKDPLEASRKVKGWAGKGWLEYGITKHADDAPIVLSDLEKRILLDAHRSG